MSIVERILDVVEKSGLKPSEIADKTGLDRASFTNWKKGRYKPSIEAIVELSKFFNISTDYFLLGKETQAQIVNAKDIIKDRLAPDERMLVNTYREIDDEGKDLVQMAIREIWADHRQPKGKFSNSSKNEMIG